jgi:hypothetical protein
LKGKQTKRFRKKKSRWRTFLFIAKKYDNCHKMQI